MPPIPSLRGGRFRRLIWILALAVFAACAFVFVRLGVLLVKEDPLQSSDAIFVLAGSQMTRPLEAADLYATGAASRIVISADARDGGAMAFEARGVHVPSGAELARETLLKIGVPAEAILVPPRIHDNTAQEAATVYELARQYGWTRVIVVTSKYHTRRAGFAMRRALKGTGVDVVMRASRYDDADPEGWWRHRDDVRVAAFEAQKFVAYLLGLGE